MAIFEATLLSSVVWLLVCGAGCLQLISVKGACDNITALCTDTLNATAMNQCNVHRPCLRINYSMPTACGARQPIVSVAMVPSGESSEAVQGAWQCISVTLKNVRRDVSHTQQRPNRSHSDGCTYHGAAKRWLVGRNRPLVRLVTIAIDFMLRRVV